MIRSLSIQKGLIGTRQTLEAMAVLSRHGKNFPEVRQAANWYGPDLDAMLRRYWRKVDEYTETLYTVDAQVRHLQQYGYMIGDCDDAAIVAGAVLLAIRDMGHAMPVRFVAVRRSQDSEFSHVFTEAFDGHYIIDPIAPVGMSYAGYERMEYPL